MSCLQPAEQSSKHSAERNGAARLLLRLDNIVWTGNSTAHLPRRAGVTLEKDGRRCGRMNHRRPQPSISPPGAVESIMQLD